MNDPNGPIYHKNYYLCIISTTRSVMAGATSIGATRAAVIWLPEAPAYCPLAVEGKREKTTSSRVCHDNSQGNSWPFTPAFGPRKSATDYAEQWAALGDATGNTSSNIGPARWLTRNCTGRESLRLARSFIFRNQARPTWSAGAISIAAKAARPW